MQEQLLLSIIVPVYNAEKYLSKCIDSIIAQSFKKFECILIDDGSTDRSLDICKEYVEMDNRFRVIHQPNQGVSVARNNGILAAKGKYIHFIDADDSIFPYSEEHMLKAIIDKGNDLLFFNYVESNNIEAKIVDLDLIECIKYPNYFDLIRHIPYIYKKKNNIIYRKGGFFSSVWRVCIKRNIIVNEELFFDPFLERGEDREFIKKLVRVCTKIGYLDEGLYI